MPPREGEQPSSTWVKIFEMFFESFKIDPEVVDALIDWIDTDDNPRGTGGAETSYYQSLPVPYVPPNGRMRTPGELRLVKGLNDAETLAKLFPGATPEAVADLDLGSNNYLTPFGAEQTSPGSSPGSPAVKVNVNTASLEVLKVLIAGAKPDSSSTEGIAEEIVAQRQEKQLTQRELDKVVPDAGLRRALRSVADVKSTYFRIESVGVVGLVQKKIVVVFKRGAQPANPANLANPASQMTMLYFKVE